MCGEIENCHHDEREVDPEIIGKDDNEDDLILWSVLQFQGTPARATIWAVAQSIWRGGEGRGGGESFISTSQT